jgi:hypothetical protein
MASEIPGHYQALTTSTTDGLTTGIINADANFVTVTSSANTKFVTLPVGYVGQVVRGWSTANGFKLATTPGGTDTINNIACGAGAGAAIPATVYFECIKTLSGGWILQTRTSLGAVATAIVPS